MVAARETLFIYLHQMERKQQRSKSIYLILMVELNASLPVLELLFFRLSSKQTPPNFNHRLRNVEVLVVRLGYHTKSGSISFCILFTY